MIETQSPSAGPLAGLTYADLGVWLIEAGRLFSVIEDFERSVEDHAAAMRRARAALKPLVFTPNTNVHFEVIDALKALAAAPGLLPAAAASVLRQPDEELSLAIATSLLKLLVNAGGEGLDEVSSLARQHFADWLDDGAQGRNLQVSIVELAGVSGGSMAVFAAVDQISASGRLDWTAGFAALRQIASQRPKLLKLAFDRILRTLAPATPSPTRFRWLLGELVERSSPVVVLSALVEMDPRSFPSLFEGAFKALDGDRPLFGMVDHLLLEDAQFAETVWLSAGGGQFVTDDMSATEVDVPGVVIFIYGGVRIAFDELLSTRAQLIWRRGLRAATGVTPDPEETPDSVVELDDIREDLGLLEEDTPDAAPDVATFDLEPDQDDYILIEVGPYPAEEPPPLEAPPTSAKTFKLQMALT